MSSTHKAVVDGHSMQDPRRRGVLHFRRESAESNKVLAQIEFPREVSTPIVMDIDSFWEAIRGVFPDLTVELLPARLASEAIKITGMPQGEVQAQVLTETSSGEGA